MNSVEDVASKLIPVLEATIELGNKNQKLHPLRQAVHDMQMAGKWLHLASQDVAMMANSSNTIRQAPEEEIEPVKPNLHPPTLLGSVASFNWIEKELNQLNDELLHYKEVPPGAALRYKLDKTYDKLMTAQFNIELAKFYYDQLNGSGKETEGRQLI